MRAYLVRTVLLAALAYLLVLAEVMRATAQDARPPPIFSSLEAPPDPAEVRAQLAAGVRIFELDLDTPGAAAAAKAIKAGGGTVTAYHIGGGGGRAWGSVRTDEWVRKYDSPGDFKALTADVRRLVGLGADAIHFDNTHRMSGKRLEAVADAIKAGGAKVVAKNNPAKWNLVMKRRPDFKPAYAVVEDAMFEGEVTQAAYTLHARGVAVYIVGFRKPIDPKVPEITDAYALEYATNNPWAMVLIIADERAWDSRTGIFIR